MFLPGTGDWYRCPERCRGLDGGPAVVGHDRTLELTETTRPEEAGDEAAPRGLVRVPVCRRALPITLNRLAAGRTDNDDGGSKRGGQGADG